MKFICNKYLNVARQHNSQLVGTINNLIFYKFRGKYCMRMKPGYVRRTKASVKSGLNFGKASKIGRQIRDVIYPINPCNADKSMICRFTGVLNKMISWKEKEQPDSHHLKKELPFVSGFQFNDEADMPTAILPVVDFTEGGMMEIRLTPFVSANTLHAPFYTDHILFKIIISSTNMTENKTEKLGMTDIRIPYNHEIFQPSVISIPLRKDQGGLILIVLAIEYFVNNKARVQKNIVPGKLPCGIVWAGFHEN